MSFFRNCTETYKKEVDKFNGKTIKETSDIKLTGFTSTAHFIISFGSTNNLNFVRVEYRGINDYIMKDSHLMFLTSDGEVVTLHATKSVTSNSKYIPSAKITLTTLNCTYSGDLSKLKDATITNIRAHFGKGYLEFKVSKGNSSKLNKAVKLVL